MGSAGFEPAILVGLDTDVERAAKAILLLGLNKNNQKMVPKGGVKSMVEQTWEFVTWLPDAEAMVRLPS